MASIEKLREKEDISKLTEVLLRSKEDWAEALDALVALAKRTHHGAFEALLVALRDDRVGPLAQLVCRIWSERHRLRDHEHEAVMRLLDRPLSVKVRKWEKGLDELRYKLKKVKELDLNLIVALGTVHKAEAADILLECLKESLNEVWPMETVVAVIKTLNKVGDPRPASLVHELDSFLNHPKLNRVWETGDMRDYGHQMVCTLISALGDMGNQAAVEPLIKLFKREYSTYPTGALTATALGKLGDPKAMPALEEALKDPRSEWCAREIEEALEKLRGKS